MATDDSRKNQESIPLLDEEQNSSAGDTSKQPGKSKRRELLMLSALFIFAIGGMLRDIWNANHKQGAAKDPESVARAALKASPVIVSI